MQENNELYLNDLFPKNICEYIVPKYSLLKTIRENDACTVIVREIKKMPNFELKLNDLEILCMVCNFIENMKIKGNTKSKKPDKENILKCIYHTIYNIDPDGDEMKMVFKSVEF